MAGVGVGVAEREAVTLQERKKKMAEFSRERDWEHFHSPRNLLLALVGAVRELSEIFQWKGEVPKDCHTGKRKRSNTWGKSSQMCCSTWLGSLTFVALILVKPHHESWSSMPSNTKSSFARARPKSTRSSMQKIILLCVAVIMACQAPKTVRVGYNFFNKTRARRCLTDELKSP